MAKKLTRADFEAAVSKTPEPGALDTAKQQNMSRKQMLDFIAQAGGKSPDTGVESHPESQYGQNYLQGESSYEQHLGRVQGPLDEFGNALGRVATNIIPGVIGSVAAILDVPDYIAGVTQQDEVGNAVTNWANEWKERTNQKWLPIYKQNDKPLDITSSEWWFENGSGIAESALEFAALGFGVGSVLKGVAASQWLKNIATVTDVVTGVSRLTPAAEATIMGTNAFLLNHAEGMLEATQVYQAELEKNMQLVHEGLLTEEQAKLNAGAAAGHTLNINRHNVFLNLTSVGSIMKGARGSRNLVRTLSTPHKLILEGGQEWLEESVNYYATRAGEEMGQALREGKDYSGASLSKFIDDALSERGVEAGFLGMLGGVAQTGLVAVGNKIKGGQDIEKAYEERQKAVGQSYENLRNEQKLKSVRDLGVAAQTISDWGLIRKGLEEEMQQAHAENRPIDNDLIARWQNANEVIQDEQLSAAFQGGTTEYTEKAYRDIGALTIEEAEKNGFSGSELDEKSPAFYRTVADRMLERLHKLEAAYNETAGYNNSLDLYKNRRNAIHKAEQLDHFTAKEAELATKAQQAVDRLLNRHTEQTAATRKTHLKNNQLAAAESLRMAAAQGAVDFSRIDEEGYDQVQDINDPTKINEPATAFRKSLIAEIRQLPEVEALTSMRNTAATAKKQLEDLETEYAEQTTRSYQNKLREEVEAKQQAAFDAVEKRKMNQAAAAQQTKDLENKLKEEHRKNEIAIDQKLKDRGISDNDRNLLNTAIKREVDTPVGQPVTYTQQEEAAMENHPEAVTQIREVLHAAVDQETMLEKPNPMVFTESDNDQTVEELKNLEEGLDQLYTNQTAPEEGTLTGDTGKMHRANNVIAWLARGYEQAVDAITGRAKFKDVDNKLNDQLADPTILDARTLKIGDEVVLRIDENGIVEDTDDNGNPIQISWQEFQEQNANNPTLLADKAPIGIYRKGENTPIGYVHLPSWMTAKRLKLEGRENTTDVETEKAKVRQIRNYVQASGAEGVATKIVQRTLGKLFIDKDKQPAPVSTNLPDTDLEYVVFYKNRLLASEKSTRDTDKHVVNQASLRNGLSYVLLPVEKNIDPKLTKYWAIPLKVNKIQEPVIESIVRATEIYLKALQVGSKGLTAEQQATVAAIMKMQEKVKNEDGSVTNFDITTEAGIINYTELYVYNHTTQNVGGPDLDFDQYFIQKYQNLPGDYHAHKFNRKKGLQFGSGKTGVTTKVNDQQFMQAWREHLANRFQHTNLKFLNNKNVTLPLINQDGTVTELAPGNSYQNYLKEHVWSTNVMGHNIAEENQPPNYVYTIQQIVEFDTSIMGVENTITTEKQRIQEQKDQAKALRETAKKEKAVKPKKETKAKAKASKPVQVNPEAVKAVAAAPKQEPPKGAPAKPVIPNLGKTLLEQQKQDMADMANENSWFDEDDLAYKTPDVTTDEMKVAATAVTGKVTVTDEQAAANIAEEHAAQEVLKQDLLKRETAYTEIDSKYALPKSEALDNASLRDLLEYWTNTIVNRYTAEVAPLSQQEKGKADKHFLQTYLASLQKNMADRLTIAPVGSKNYKIAKYALDNWSIIENLIKNNLQRDHAFSFKVYKSKQAEDEAEANRLKSLEDMSREGDENPEDGDSNDAANPDEQQSTKQTFGLDSLQQDPAKKLSPKFRRFLGGLKDTSRKYLLIKDQHPNFKPVKLYRTLSALLANMDPDFDLMLAKLDKASNLPGFEYLAIVRRALMNADEQVKAEFVVTMSKHYVNMKHLYVMAKDYYGTKYYEGYIRDDNYNAKVEVIKDRWEHDLYLSSIAKDYDGEDFREGRQIYDKQGVDEAIQMYEELLLANGETPHGQQTGEVHYEDFHIDVFLGLVGMNFSPGVLESLREQGIREQTDPKKAALGYRNMFFASDGEFYRIYQFLKNIQAEQDDIFIEDKLLTGEAAVHRLAGYEAKFSVDALSTSHKSGNKKIFSYADNKYLFDRARLLGGVKGGQVDAAARQELFEKLVNSPFVGSQSQELRQILEWDENTKQFKKDAQGNYLYNPDSEYNKNFNISYTSLSMLIQKGIPAGNKNALEDLDSLEHAITKFMLFQNRGVHVKGKARRGQLFHMTLADKNTMILFEKPIPQIQLNEDGSIADSTVDVLYEFAVLPEIKRMLAFDENFPPDIAGYAQGQRLFHIFTKLNLVDELFTIQRNKKGEEVNRRIRQDVTSDLQLRALINQVIKSTISTDAAFTLQTWQDVGMMRKDAATGKLIALDYLDVNYRKWVSSQLKNAEAATTELKDIANYAAQEMAVAYMLHNVNMYQLISTDPAVQYKYKAPEGTEPGVTVDVMDEVFQTSENISKRLGGEISPGRDGHNQQTGKTYALAAMDDIKIPSKALAAYQKLFEKNPKAAAAYKNLTSTDGAEFISLPEKLRFMREFAKLDPEQLAALNNIEEKYSKAIKAIEKGQDPSQYDFYFDELDLIFQVDKPIMVGTRVDQGVEAKIFVKSAAFTLIPQLVRDTELEKLMAFMSNANNPIDRLACKSAFKLGAPAKVLTLFDNNGNFIEGSTLDPSNVLITPRKYLRLQQETPYKETTEIARVSQASKQLFTNLLDVDGFELPGVDGKFTGRQLNQEYNKHFEYLYKSSREELIKELGVKTDKYGKVTIDHVKLNKLIQDELVSRGYPAHDLDALEITQFPEEQKDAAGNIIPLPEGVEPQWRFKMPIWAAAQSGKLEAFLNSLITNRILKQKFNGYGFVLGPEGGYKYQDKGELADTKGVATNVKQLSKKLRNQIVYTDKFDPKTGLKPALANNGYNQVILPWKFKQKLGAYIVNGKLDTSKFDPELLRAYGMRIPNQGLNSTAAIEIVGFFPPAAGDLLVAPADFTAQMGSDFDIDKLYTYMYHYNVAQDGSIKKINSNAKGDQVSRETTQNKLLDIYLSVNTNPHPVVKKLIATPLTTSDLGDIADRLAQARKARSLEAAQAGGKVSPHDLSPASGNYQSYKYLSNVVATTAIGAFAVQNTFNAMAQQVEGGLHLVKQWDEKGNPKKYRNVTFGEEKFKGHLSGLTTKSGAYISTNISAMLSAAVDNGNDPLLDRLGVNPQNLSIVNFLLQAGFELETIANFISQDIIQEYVKQLAIHNNNATKAFNIVTEMPQFKFNDDLYKAGGDPKRIAKTKRKKFDPKEENWEEDHEAQASGANKNPVYERYMNAYNSSSEEMFELIAQGEKAAGYKEKQYALLNKFQHISNHAGKLRALQGLSNIDSKGIGANMFQSLLQQQDIEELGGGKALDILNAGKLFGDFKSTKNIADGSAAAQDLLDQGYVKGDDYYFKPTSIPGFAYAYGVLTNNKIWHDHFPYAKPEVLRVVEQIANKMKGSAGSVFSTSEQYRKIFRELKSYLFTDNLVTPINPAAARKLLLHNYEKADGTEQVSLANILYEVKKNPATAKIFRENAFLNNLYLKATPDKRKPKVVMFRQPADDEVTNRDIYNEVYNLVKYPVEFGVFNGIKYDSRKFIEHLLLASNVSMTSAMQINLMQFIPTELLVKAGYGDRLHSYDWTRLQQNPVGQPYRATVQYFQHQPTLTPEIDLRKDLDSDFIIYGHDELTEQDIKSGLTVEDIQDLARRNTANIKQFSLSNDYVLSDDGAPNFLHAKVGDKILLYQLTDKDLKQYSRIPTLLNSATSDSHEYDANVAHAVSVIPENNPQVLTVPAADTGRQELPLRTGNTGNEAHNKKRKEAVQKMLSKYGLRRDNYKITDAQVDHMLYTIFEQSKLESNRILAHWLREMITSERKQFHVKFSFDSLPDYSYGATTVFTKTGQIQVYIDPSQIDPDHAESDFEHVVLHELVHSITKIATLQGGNANLKTLGEIHPAQKRAYKNLKKLYEEYKKMYLGEGHQHQKLAAKLMKKNFNPETDLTAAEKEEYADFVYPGHTIDEFIVAIMTRPALRQRLQSLPYPNSTETFWEKIQSIFDFLLEAFGLEPDTTAANAVKDVMFLSRQGNVNFANAKSLQVHAATYGEVHRERLEREAAEKREMEIEDALEEEGRRRDEIEAALQQHYEDLAAEEEAAEKAKAAGKKPKKSRKKKPVIDQQSNEQPIPAAELIARQEIYDQAQTDRIEKIDNTLTELNVTEADLNQKAEPGSEGAVKATPALAAMLKNRLKETGKATDLLSAIATDYFPAFMGEAATEVVVKRPKIRKKGAKRTPKVALRISKLLEERKFTLEQIHKHETELRNMLKDYQLTKTKEDIKRLQKRLAKVRANKEAVQEEYDKIVKLKTTEAIVAIGAADIAAITESLIDPSKLDIRDFHIIQTRLDLWLNYEENFLENKEQESLIAYKLFQEIVAEASRNRKRLLNLQKERMYNWAMEHFQEKLTPEVFYAAMKDIGWLPSITLGADHANHPLIQAIAQRIQLSEAEQQEEFHGIQQEIKTLFKAVEGKEAITGKAFKNFFELDSNGVFTGNIVRPYSSEFLAQKEALRAAISAATTSKAKAKARARLNKYRQENELFFDLRKLIKLPGYEEMHTADAGKLEAELKSVMGEIRYNETLKEAQAAYEQAINEEENKLEEYELQHAGNPEKIKNAFNLWKSNNSIIDYWEYMTNPGSKTAKSSATQYGYRHAFSVPKAFNTEGKSQYSEQYLKLQQDPDVAALHKYILDLLEKLRSYIPEHQQREFAANSLPTIEKDMIEMLKTEGLVATMASMRDKIKMGFTSQERQGNLYGIDSGGRSLDIKVQTLTNDIQKLYKQKVRDYERSTGETLEEDVAADQAKLAEFYKQASEEVQAVTSLDLPHMLARFAQALTVYRHKAKIEDVVRLGENTFIQTAKENQENSAGDPVHRILPEGQAQIEQKKAAHANHMVMLSYHLDRFFEVQKPTGSQTSIKSYSAKDKKRLDQLEAELAKHKEDLSGYEAELANLKDTSEGLSEKELTQRSKQLADIETKRAATAAKIEEVNLEMQILGAYVTEAGIVNSAIKATIVKNLGWNIFGGVTNVLIGTMSNAIEASGERWYNPKEFRQAMRIALNSTVKSMTLGGINSNNAKKLNALMGRWDILKSVAKEQFRDGNLADTALGALHWGQVYKTSEYMNQGSVLVAMMLHQKITDLAGNESNLWEAFGKTGEWDTERFGPMEDKFSAKERAWFKAKVDKVIRNNHGNYSRSLEVALKEKSWGKILAMFRSWMFEGFRSRFEASSKDYVYGQERKGRYRSYLGSSASLGLGALGTAILPGVGTAIGLTAGYFIGNKFNDTSRFKKGFENTSPFEELMLNTKFLVKKLTFGAMFSGVTLEERFNEVDAVNLRRNMSEISFLLFAAGAIQVLAWMIKGSDDDDEKRVLMYSLNTINRLQQDIGFYANPVTTMQILQDPVPILSLVKDSFGVIKASSGLVLDPDNDEITTGNYAGESKAKRAWFKLIPGLKSIQSTANMAEQELRQH